MPPPEEQVRRDLIREWGEFLDLAARVDAPLARSLAAATALDPYGVELRYPGDQPEPSVDEATEALRFARRVRDAMMCALS